jgi:valyl-tRNA synthetase
VREVVTALRAYRSRRGLAPRSPLVVDPAPHPAVAALDAVSAAPAEVRATLATTLLGDGRSILLGPAAQTVDPEVERARLREELATVENELERATRKLADTRFVERAPAHLVDGEREKVARYAAEREALGSRIAALG